MLNAATTILPNPRRQLRLDDAFFSVGGDSLNMVLLIEAVYEHAGGGYSLPMTAFTPACTFRDLVYRLRSSCPDLEYAKENGSIANRGRGREDDCSYSAAENAASYDQLLLADVSCGQLLLHSRYVGPADREAVIDMISAGFSGKGDLELALGTVTYDNVRSNVEANWLSVLEAGLSIVAYAKKRSSAQSDDEEELVGACINTDVRGANYRQGHGSFGRVLSFLARVEQPFMETRIPQETGRFYSSMLGTARHLR